MTAPENKPPIPHPPITEATREFVKAQKAEPKSALEESIEHWERLATGNRQESETVDGDSCALCRKFYAKNKCCDGCPVDNRTEMGCFGSPWRGAYISAQEDGLDSPEFRAAAQKELDFLKSLRPTSEGSTES